MALVYKTTNIINDKFYIGVHNGADNNMKRWHFDKCKKKEQT